jgi:hypothetical protein
MSNSFVMCDSTNFWWSFVLGYKHGFTDNSLCAGWCWYLAVDFCLFLFVPFLCWGFNFKRPVGIALSVLGVATCSLITIV